jgi:chromosome segregation ATPase
LKAVKEKVSTLISEYKKEVSLIKEKVEESEKRLNDLSLEIRYIEEKEIPEAIKKRVLTGDRSHETKLRKALEKLQKESVEKNEDLLVLDAAVNNYIQQKADEIQKILPLFNEELNMIRKEKFDRIKKSREVYLGEIIKETALLHLYQSIETEIQNIEVVTGRRRYTQSTYLFDYNNLKNLSISPNEVVTAVNKKISRN